MNWLSGVVALSGEGQTDQHFGQYSGAYWAVDQFLIQ